MTAQDGGELTRVTRLVQPVFPGSRAVEVSELAGGMSAASHIVTLIDERGTRQQVVIRIPRTTQNNSHTAQAEFDILRLIQSLGLPVPAPQLLDGSCRIIPNPCIVMEFISGTHDFAPVLPEVYAVKYANMLWRIHAAELDTDKIALLRGQPPKPDWLIGPAPLQTENYMQEGRLRDLLAHNWPARGFNPPRLVHGDYWPGNVLWRDREIVAVLDWEDARFADPLMDLAIARLDLALIFGAHVAAAFAKAYRDQARGISFDHQALWDLCAAIRFVRLTRLNLASWAAGYQHYGRFDITESLLRDRYTVFVTNALEEPPFG